MSDNDLIREVQRDFSQMHLCYVSVSRDKRGLANAFVQYTYVISKDLG